MLTEKIQEKFPFLSLVTYGSDEYIGVIINQDNAVTSMYVYADIRSTELQRKFLELGDVWWWESNRLLPINIFLKHEMEPFRDCIMSMSTKDVKVVLGPCVNLNSLSVKRVKRKNVQLVRKPKN